MSFLRTFIKDYTLQNLRKKLGITYLFTVLDITLTLLLLKTGYFIEANPLMKNIVTNPFQSFCMKVLLPAILLVYLGWRMKSATSKQLKVSNYFINMLNLIYLLLVSFQIIYCIAFLFISLF